MLYDLHKFLRFYLPSPETLKGHQWFDGHYFHFIHCADNVGSRLLLGAGPR